MSDSEIKNRLHELIENSSNRQVLEKIYQELSSGEDDWWHSLTTNQKLRLQESEEQYKTGQVVSNEAVLKKIAACFKNSLDR